MPETPVLAQAPLSLNVNGHHLMIPLSALYFDANGVLKADRWPLYAANQAAVDSLVKRLFADGALTPGRPPATKPAFTATAITTGATGIVIEIEIANVVPNAANPPNSKADFKVTETETYTAMQPDKLKDVIGTAANGGTRPGLVFVSGAGVPLLPDAGVYPLAGDPGTVDVTKNGGGGAGFTLQSRAGGADAALTSVEIKDVDTAAKTFTMIVKWTKTANAQAMSGLAAAFAYDLVVTAPSGGFLAPAAGKIVLSGGSDAIAIAPVKASATALAQ